MGKVSMKKRTMKGLKKAPDVPDKTTEVNLEELPNAGEAITDDEDEGSDDERRHQKLLEAINSLGTKRKKKLFERSEASNHMSEFTVMAEGEGVKIKMSDLLKSLDKVPDVSGKTKRQLKSLQDSKKPLACPLSKEETERIQRDLAFQKAATEVTSWQNEIKQNDRAEQLVFPLRQEPSGPKTIEKVVNGWKAKTPLEQEIFALLSANKKPADKPILTPAEQASVKAMSLLDAKMRRAELQKVRAQQSYYEAKARRESKIKSKTYHKVLNKAKRKDFLKKFDELVQKDPTSALEEMDKMEVARMQERMSLKHQNSGKWAVSKVIMAKYDKSARQAMQQQLDINKDLTLKRPTPLQDNVEEEEDPEVVPDFANEAVQGADPSNPWMRGTLLLEPASEDVPDVQPQPAVDVEEAEESEVEETEEESLLREFDRRRKTRQAQEAVQVGFEDSGTGAAAGAAKKEEEQRMEFTKLYREKVGDGQEALLQESLHRIQSFEDMELLGGAESVPDKAPDRAQQSSAAPEPLPGEDKAQKTCKRKRDIQLKDVLTKDTKVIQVPLAPTAADGEDSEEKLGQMGLIKEAFAGDDVVADFLREKGKQEGAGKPAAVSLALPGWGSWGGTGIQMSKRKRRKFAVKTEPPPPRKDQNKLGVIISEKRNSAISLHQVNSLPFPFNEVAQFERTVCAPVGRTWNTERTVKALTKRKVITQHGAFIQPMVKEDLLKGKSSSRRLLYKK
ncbi:U3 small nucleolar RNA-associated protein 14 homolog A [Nerophis ophidion]|uniref:U3 small nucleolar RNA-associated protein 14 homolog A n=1 Tax=Nerophis ophidion TaxID=159077 RepID=UPI002ADFD7D1|nr:U3 small nucleolar RNA-associated protein 14 homolog A [Nerophis ophidion]